MAITVRKNQKTGAIVGYQVTVRLPGESSKSKTFPTYAREEKYELDITVAVRSSRLKKSNRTAFAKAAKPGVAALSSELLSDLLVEFKEKSPDHRFGRHVKSMLSSVDNARVCDLSDDWCKRWCQRLRKQSNGRGATLSDGTLAHYIKILRFACRCKADALGIDPKYAPEKKAPPVGSSPVRRGMGRAAPNELISAPEGFAQTLELLGGN